MEPFTKLSLLFPDRFSPSHLRPAANYTINDSLHSPSESHRLDQWFVGPVLVWKSGTEVGELDFGRQLAQRLYHVQKGYISLPLDETDVKLMVYAQRTSSKAIQLALTTATGGIATSKRKQIMFMFNTAQEARDVQSMWSLALRSCDIKDYIRAMSDYEFLLQKFDKDAITFFIYAVKRKQVEIEWKHVLDRSTTKVHVHNSMKIIRTVGWTGFFVF